METSEPIVGFIGQLSQPLGIGMVWKNQVGRLPTSHVGMYPLSNLV